MGQQSTHMEGQQRTITAWPAQHITSQATRSMHLSDAAHLPLPRLHPSSVRPQVESPGLFLIYTPILGIPTHLRDLGTICTMTVPVFLLHPCFSSPATPLSGSPRPLQLTRPEQSPPYQSVVPLSSQVLGVKPQRSNPWLLFLSPAHLIQA